MSDIFISYASEDRPRVKPLVDALQQQGWSVWWDRTIRAGRPFDRAIEAALKDARCVVVFWSRASIDSDWVWTEANEAKQRGILVPALLDDVDIPLAFRRIQAANLVGWSGGLPSAQVDELALAVSEVLATYASPLLDTSPHPRYPSASGAMPLEEQPKAQEEKVGQEELERKPLKDERGQAAAEKARVEEQEHERLAAADRARLKEERLSRGQGRSGALVPSLAIVSPALKKVALAACGILAVALIVYWATRPKQQQRGTQTPGVQAQPSSHPPAVETSSGSGAGDKTAADKALPIRPLRAKNRGG